jgi:hypothetical protein
MIGPYEGVHGFLFLHEEDATPPEEVIEGLRKLLDRENSRVFFASLFDGAFAGFAHYAAADLPALGQFVNDELFKLGVRTDNSTEAVVHTPGAIPMGPKRQSPRFCGLCRVRTTEKPLSVMDAIGVAFGNLPPLIGASLVIGRFSLLVELGSDDMDGLNAAIVQLRGVPGVGDIRVGTADTGAEEARKSGA